MSSTIVNELAKNKKRYSKQANDRLESIEDKLSGESIYTSPRCLIKIDLTDLIHLLGTVTMEGIETSCALTENVLMGYANAVIAKSNSSEVISAVDYSIVNNTDKSYSPEVPPLATHVLERALRDVEHVMDELYVVGWDDVSKGFQMTILTI